MGRYVAPPFAYMQSMEEAVQPADQVMTSSDTEAQGSPDVNEV